MNTLKEIGSTALFIIFFIGLILLGAMFLKGAIWLSATLYPWLVGISGTTLAITVFFLIPNAIFSPIPKIAGIGMVIASYVFGTTLWTMSLLLTYLLWGGWAVFIGLFIFGIGVVPMAMLAIALKGIWLGVGELALLLVLSLGLRFWGAYLLVKIDEKTVEPQLQF
ncbi:MAG: hypothetical protein AB1515_06885 [Nitrospirota bacterium]